MGRGAGHDPAPSLASQVSISVTVGSRSEPTVPEDATDHSLTHRSHKARSMLPRKRDGGGSRKRRLLLATGSAAILAAAATLSAGATFGLFRATTTTQTNHVSSGTVTLASDTSGTCNATNMLPGASPTSCTLKATYSGNVPAYLGLDVLIETQAGSGGTRLFNPTDSTNDLQVTITDNQGSPVTYVVPTTATTCPGGAPTGSTCYELDNEIVRLASVPASTAITFTTSASIPTISATGYQNGAAQIILTAHAVQAGNNGSTATCSAGHRCDTTSPGAGAPSWS